MSAKNSFDVKVMCYTYGKTNMVTFKFFNDLEYLVGDRVHITVKDNTVYFEPRRNKKNSFKVKKDGSVQVYSESAKMLAPFKGQYPLKNKIVNGKEVFYVEKTGETKILESTPEKDYDLDGIKTADDQPKKVDVDVKAKPQVEVKLTKTAEKYIEKKSIDKAEKAGRPKASDLLIKILELQDESGDVSENLILLLLIRLLELQTKDDDVAKTLSELKEETAKTGKDFDSKVVGLLIKILDLQVKDDNLEARNTLGELKGEIAKISM